jgi:organic radical activating enzyme
MKQIFPSIQKYKALASEVLNTKLSVTLYGYGNIGKYLVPKLHKIGLSVNCILDRNPDKMGKSIDGIKIISPDEYNDTDGVIVICSVPYFFEIEEYLIKRSFDKILPYFFYDFGKEVNYSNNDAFNLYGAISIDYEILKRNVSEKLWIKSVDISITEVCTLKCKDCSNLMQYFKNPKHADFNQLTIALDKLMDSVDYCSEIRILGGEPFANKELIKYLEHVKNYNKYNWVMIYTNATILPNNDLLKLLKNQKVLVQISNYGNKKQKCLEMSNLLNNVGIYNFVAEWTLWQDCSGLSYHKRTNEEKKQIFKYCCVKETWSIADGMLFRCPFAANAFKLKAIPHTYTECIDLCATRKRPEAISEEIKIMSLLPYLKVCDYCGGRNFNVIANIPAAIQIDKPLEYRIYEK